MSSQPYLRAADDGTYELLIPLGKGSVHILPYCFHTEIDAANWLASRKGREQIQHIRRKLKKRERIAGVIRLKRSRPWSERIESLIGRKAVNVAARMISS